MLLCRRIFRAHASSLERFVARNNAFLTLRYNHTNPLTCEDSSKIAQLSPSCSHDQLEDPKFALLDRVLRISRYSVAWTKKGPTSDKARYSPFEAFAELRAQDPTLSASLPTTVLCRLADGAVKHGSQLIVDYLKADILDDHLLHQEQRAEVATFLLCVPRRYPTLFDKRTTLSLLSIIRKQDRLSALLPSAASHVLRTAMDDIGSDALDRSSSNLVLDIFAKHLTSLQTPTGTEAVARPPLERISFAYSLVDKLVSLKWHREAFNLFQTLTDAGHIPAEAFHAELPSVLAQDFAVIVRSTLARACLHWEWYHQGVGLIESIMKSQDSPKQDLEPLVLELLHASLLSCSPDQFKACSWLMRHLVGSCYGITIPTPTIHLFYARAMRIGDYEAAHEFYSCTQSHRVRTMIDYPSPQGTTLTWLMAYLVQQKHDVYLARCLAKRAVHSPESIPRLDRGRFIALAATHGFASETRALWERYSVGPGRRLVVKNTATMLRVVSVFTQRNMWTRAKLRRETFPKQDVDEGQSNLEEREADYHRFANQVLDTFRESILPLEEASHFELSALARGYFMLGKMREGLRPFRILIERCEIPDWHDINIALSAMAHQSPRAAIQVVERMIGQGLQPDAVTFGTVLHEAIVHGDTDLAREVCDRARVVGVSLSPKTMVSIILASVTIDEDTDDRQLDANVRQAWEIVREAGEWSVVQTPNVGKRCVAACLHLDNPVMAFNFWERLIHRKTEWWDRKQRQQRRDIMEMIRRHCAEKRLSLQDGRVMLRVLGYNK